MASNNIYGQTIGGAGGGNWDTDRNIHAGAVVIGKHKLDNDTLGMLLDAGQFMKYLIEVDPDIKDKYTAFRAAKRILNKE